MKSSSFAKPMLLDTMALDEIGNLGQYFPYIRVPCMFSIASSRRLLPEPIITRHFVERANTLHGDTQSGLIVMPIV